MFGPYLTMLSYSTLSAGLDWAGKEITPGSVGIEQRSVLLLWQLQTQTKELSNQGNNLKLTHRCCLL